MYQRQVSFGEAIEKGWNQYCNFTGRASRSEFWWFALFVFIVEVCTGIISAVLGLGDWPTCIVSLVFFLPQLGLAWRRLHDIGKGGGWYFIALIPIVGAIILLIWYLKESEPYPNRFGEVPNLVA